MDVIVRGATSADVRFLIESSWLGANITELKQLQATYFDKNDKYAPRLTGYPERCLVAENEGRVVGFIHYFTDNWDDGRDEIISQATNHHLLVGEAKQVLEQLSRDLSPRS